MSIVHNAMNNASNTSLSNQPGIGASLRAGWRALQWRPLLLWIAVLLIPTVMVAMPLWHILSDQLDHTIHGSDLAQRLTLDATGDLVGALTTDGAALPSMGTLAVIFTLLATPFLNGMMVTAAKSAEVLGLSALIAGGLAEYWRMFRMFIVSLIPLAVAGGIGAAAMNGADKYAEHAILRSSADHASLAAQIVLGLLLLLAWASIDAGRAQFAISSRKRSAFKAWWRGTRLLFKRPVAVFGSYLVLTLIGAIVFAVLALLRINVPHVSVAGFVIGLILTQLAAATLAWIRGARLFALTEITKANA